MVESLAYLGGGGLKDLLPEAVAHFCLDANPDLFCFFSAVCHAELVVASVLANIKKSFTQLAKTEVGYPSLTSLFCLIPQE